MSDILTLSSRPLALLALLLLELLAGASNSMAQNTIDFSKGTNLKAVYDAGLRPWRVRPDEMRSLKITNQELRVIAPGATSFIFDVEIGNFGLLAGNDLSKAEFISHPMSLSQAAAKAREVCLALNISMAGLEEKVSQFATLGKRTPVPQYWNGRGEKSGTRFDVTLSPLFGFDETRGKVFVAFDFYQRGKPMKFLTEPVKPPPGYEHMSMDPPETNPSKPFPDPAYSFDKMKQRIEEAKAAEGRASTPTMAPSSPPPFATPKPSPVVQTESPKSVAWPWIISAILLLAVAGGVLIKFLPK